MLLLKINQHREGTTLSSSLTIIMLFKEIKLYKLLSNAFGNLDTVLAQPKEFCVLFLFLFEVYVWTLQRFIRYLYLKGRDAQQ